MESTFTNPIYPRNFPDPFVLKFRGEYWAYGTGVWRDGRWFGVLRSRDLVAWEELDGAVEPLPGSWPCVWAPEVSYHNGTFYLYYSCGDETTMQLRVATASHPAGPFHDSGRRLSAEPFAIDAHVFVDDDGARHLFYATDFLDHSHVGTGTARVRLADPLTPVGAPAPVTLPRFDWQVFDPQRATKGGVRWHTIEGSFVLKRKGRYFQMFSGGNWQNPSYGVSYAISDRLDTPAEWSQVADGEQVTPILRTVPGLVIGPGHNSAVRGPNNRELFCVYHRWSDDGRARMAAIDRLDWAGERMFLIGPTTTPQPVPLPGVADFFDAPHADGLGPGWSCEGGSWACVDGQALQRSPDPAVARRLHAAAQFVAEVSLRGETAGGRFGVAIGDAARVLIDWANSCVLVARRAGHGWETQSLALPADFAPTAWHLLRVELNAGRLHVQLDAAAAHWATRIAPGAQQLALVTDGGGAAFAGFALTAGWEDLFFPGDAAPADWGWQGRAGWRVADGALQAVRPTGPLLKGPLPAAYEIAVSARLADALAAAYGFRPAARPGDLGPLVTVERAGTGWAVVVRAGGEETPLALPDAFDAASFQQLRAVIADGACSLSWEGRALGSFRTAPGASQIGLHADGAAEFDMVRVTELGRRVA